MKQVIALCGLLMALAGAAQAASALDRIRAEGNLRCGASERPGIAETGPEGVPSGVTVDLCRAIAVAVLGPSAPIVFTMYEPPNTNHGSDDIAFLTGSEIAEMGAANSLLPGPTVLISTIAIMVPEASPVRRLADLSGQTVCLMIGSRAQRALEGTASRLHLAISRLTFEEDVEMLDAYNAGSCGAAVGETTYLADMRTNPGVRGLTSRLLPEILAADPIIVATPRGDGAWAAQVAWVIDALMLADAPADAWAADAANSLPAQRMTELQRNWRADVAAAVGSYATIIRRNLTEHLGLPAGPNALWPEGLLLPPAVR